MSPRASLPTANPFSTRFVRPGALPFLFPSNESLGQLVERFVAQGRRGQIVGPHGSGKSTLLAALVDTLREAGTEVRAFTQREGQRALAGKLPSASQAPGVLVVDGYEQLNRWNAWRLSRCYRLRGWGLLVTTHRATRLPTVYRMQPSLAVTEQLRQKLLPSGDNRVTSADVEGLFARHGGNIRETLFGLYELYELRRRGKAKVAPPFDNSVF